MSKQTPGVVIAGVGRFGALHLRVWQEAGARVLALVDRDGARASALAEQYGVDVVAEGLPQALDRVEADVVVIATDEASHVDLSLQALARRLHVFVEKPLALSSEDAWRVHARAREQGREVVVGHISRFAAPYRRMRERTEQGAVGTLSALRLRRDFSRDWFHAFGDRVDPVWESAIHDIDLAISFVHRPARSVTAVRSEAAGDLGRAVVSALIEFDDGVIATIETAWLIPSTAPATLAGALELDGAIVGELEVLGTEGILRQRLASDGLVEWTRTGMTVPDLWLWPEEGGRIGGALRTEVESALAAFAAGAPSRDMPLTEACWGIEIAEGIVRSLSTGEKVQLSAIAGGSRQ